jgi:hypothetical protein
MSNQLKNIPTKTNPKFGIIAPVEYLSEYAIQSSFHLTLAHLVDTNEEYAAFYRERSELGDFIICDNGAFELGESYEPSKLVSLAEKCGADVVVLPDYPFCPGSKTIAAASRVIDKVKAAGFKTMFVPQSEKGDMEDWMDTYSWATYEEDIDLIGMSILGIPNALPHIPKSYARVVMTQLLIDRGFVFDKYHHYLGVNAGMGLEIPTLVMCNAINSCDSSNPVWHGILGHEYSLNTDSLLPTKKINMSVQFDIKRTNDKETHRRIQHNINLTMKTFKLPGSFL